MANSIITDRAAQTDASSYTAQSTGEVAPKIQLTLNVPGMQDRPLCETPLDVSPKPDILEQWEMEETWLVVSANGRRTSAPRPCYIRLLLFASASQLTARGATQSRRLMARSKVGCNLKGRQRRRSVRAVEQFLATGREGVDGQHRIFLLLRTLEHRGDAREAIGLSSLQPLCADAGKQSGSISQRVACRLGKWRCLLQGSSSDLQTGVATKASSGGGRIFHHIEGAVRNEDQAPLERHLLGEGQFQRSEDPACGERLAQALRRIVHRSVEKAGDPVEARGAQGIARRASDEDTRRADRCPRHTMRLQQRRAGSLGGEDVNHQSGIGGIVLLPQLDKQSCGGARIFCAAGIRAKSARQPPSQGAQLGASGQIRKLVGQIERDLGGGERMGQFTHAHECAAQQIEQLEMLSDGVPKVEARANLLVGLFMSAARCAFLLQQRQDALQLVGDKRSVARLPSPAPIGGSAQ
jgi:hypothetical protein